MQVAEVISKNVSRITISGWFHSEAAGKLKSVSTPAPELLFVDAHSHGVIMIQGCVDEKASGTHLKTSCNFS